MKKIDPYKSLNEASLALDNGGRFYNLLTKAEDGIISSAELGKVAGLFNDKQKMILFLEMSVSQMNQSTKNQLLGALDPALQAAYQKYKPQEFLPSAAHQKGILSANSIITGIPKYTESKSDFLGFIMVPIVAGKVTTLVMIPLIEQYDVYHLRDEESADEFLIAHAKGSEKLPERKIKVAGVLKELKAKKEEEKASEKFLEAVYFVEL